MMYDRPCLWFKCSVGHYLGGAKTRPRCSTGWVQPPNPGLNPLAFRGLCFSRYSTYQCNNIADGNQL